MALNEFKPKIWSDKVFESYNKNFVFAALANREYEGEIKNFGESVKINELGDVTVKDYTGSVLYEELDDASKLLLIDQKKYAAVTVDDADEVQTKPKLLNLHTAKIALGLADNLDQALAGKYTEAGETITGTTGSPTAITSANIISTMGNAGVALDDNNVPSDNRVAIVPPWLYNKMSLAGIVKSTDNPNFLAKGFVGEFMGFDIFKSNNISHSGTSWYAPMIFRSNDTIALADQLQKMEGVRDKDTFGDYMRMLHIYGCKVVRPTSLATMFVSNGTETAI